MSAFALRCDRQGVIREIIGETPSIFVDSLDQLFTANKHLIDIKKALNFYLAVKNNRIEANWELAVNEDGELSQYKFSGFVYGSDIFIIGERMPYESFEDLNKINIEFSDLIRKVTREKVSSKRHFMDTASHELRTPNTVISGYLEMVLENYQENIPAEAYKWLKIVMQNAKRLEKITDGLIDLERIDSGLVEVQKRWIMLESLVDEIVARKSDELNVKNLEVFSRIDVREVYADKDMLLFVLDEVIDNAIKFSSENTRVSVVAERVKDGVQVSVCDQGIVINSMHVDLVFLPFEYIPKPDYYGGIGMSLSLCKAYVELHGGSIWIESSEENGTTVSFTLPN